MGVSNRAKYAIEPKAGDLWVPDRKRQPRMGRVRDIEDASFETVITHRDVFSTRARDAGGTVFKSRIGEAPAEGPFPRDFAGSERTFEGAATQGERLGVFAGNNPVFATAQSRPSMVMPAVFLATCAAAVAVVWITGIDARSGAPAENLHASPASPQAARVSQRIEAPADPVVTSSIPATVRSADKEGFTPLTARPARIERAGSILMIRPAAD